jgi:hypothetical protein
VVPLVASVAKKAGLGLVVLLAVLLAGNAMSYINFDSSYGFLKLKEKAIATGWYLPFYYSHVLVAGMILLVGLFQIVYSSKKGLRKIHRYLGYFYVMGILFFAAPGGLVMSLFIDRGAVVLASFVLQSILWFYFTATAFKRILTGNVLEHKQYMWRSYSLTFAAITLRVYIFLFSWSFDMSQPGAYATMAWLSWVPNLLFVELFVNRSLSIRNSVLQTKN